MRKSRFTDSQIVAILNEGESGIAVAEICRGDYRITKTLAKSDCHVRHLVLEG